MGILAAGTAVPWLRWQAIDLLYLVPLTYVVYFFVRGVYRITLHPLAKFPGPKLAAWTRWYEVYYEMYRGGRFSDQIEEMHRQYGPIVRVNPRELHINDPAFYDKLYNLSPEIDRYKVSIENLQNTPSFDMHKIRRKALEPYFSKPAVLKLESTVVVSSVKEMCHWLHEARRTGMPVNLTVLARCLTSDIITEYIFAKPYGFLQDPEASMAFFAANDSVFKSFFAVRESKVVERLLHLMQQVPTSWLPKGHMAHTLVPWLNSVRDRIKLAQQRRKDGKSESVAGVGHRVLFDDWDTLDLPARDKTFAVQHDSALMLVGAGFETTAYTLEQAVFHILANPPILARLRQELAPLLTANNINMASATKKTTTTAAAAADALPSWAELEKLPYLTAVIYESLRMSLGVAARLPRKNSRADMVYNDWVIPRGQLVGMTQRDILYNPDIYPDPMRFDPERWLQGEPSRELLQKYLVTFSKGARRCIGMHLAYAELYLALAAIFGQFELELHETTRRDVDPKVDYFIPKPEPGTNGLRVLVK